MKTLNNKILSVLLDVAKNAADGNSSLDWKHAIVPVYRMLVESDVFVPVRIQGVEAGDIAANVLFLPTEYGVAMPVFMSMASVHEKTSLIPISFVDVCKILLEAEEPAGVIIEPFKNGLFISKETILCLMDKSLVLQDDGCFIKFESCII
ncbi:MAG: SseB family protein [Alphaproteobacteria bacterium]|nr:SseB family protein [Alphaproteobacteria bacterium]